MYSLARGVTAGAVSFSLLLDAPLYLALWVIAKYATRPLSILFYYQCCRKNDRVKPIIHGREVQDILEWYDLIMGGFLTYEVIHQPFLEILTPHQDFHYEYILLLIIIRFPQME